MAGGGPSIPMAAPQPHGRGPGAPRGSPRRRPEAAFAAVAALMACAWAGQGFAMRPGSFIGAACAGRRASRQPPRLALAAYAEPKVVKKVPWWQEDQKKFLGRMQVEESTDSIERLRRQMTAEESAFDQEIEDVVIAGKRALLRLRMQKAVETPGMKNHLFKAIRKQIARALTLRREREIARGITREQSRRMRRRKRLELKVQYEDAWGSEHTIPKSAKWKRRMGRII
uniref:Large ribosomal subunit protein uL29c n=1 Tax=Alexandrium catenella TaxID=2925 RepID=A0A7S1MJ15_ALECA|mmetsp:Transcript_2786/g.7479  ORF Transcript_2786/g.7479 Transcript_2786/m.7479 type:complete len:228 (+) Transcript_2786:3-686(+)